MRRRLMGAAVLAAFGLMAQEVVLTNRHLKVTVEPKSGEISVLDRRNNYSWRQPALELLTQRKPVACPQLPGKEASFDILPTMLGDAREVSGAADCSARSQSAFTLARSGRPVSAKSVIAFSSSMRRVKLRSATLSETIADSILPTAR